ncbi:MAG: DUF494 domain-containing protein [Ostreibacterium sp.]
MQQQHSVLDTLVYLFDYLVYEKKMRPTPTVDEMHEELGAAGFAKKDIDRAMAWLLDLNDLQQDDLLRTPSDDAVRQFTDAEIEKMSKESRGFLYQLAQMGVIDTRLREILIQKLMTLDEDSIHVDEVKWVTLMAIFNRPEQEANATWLEQSLLSGSTVGRLH